MIRDKIGQDRLFRLHKNLNLKELTHKNGHRKQGHSDIDYIYSLRIYQLIGNYVLTPHYIYDCLFLTLRKDTKVSWYLATYILKETTGRTSSSNGRPKTFLKADSLKSITRNGSLQRRLRVKSCSNWYTSIKSLVDREIIYFLENNGSGYRLFFNPYPETWIVEEELKREIVEIIDLECERVRKKIEEQESP